MDVAGRLPFKPHSANVEGLIWLRDKRDGDGDGRAYTIDAAVRDGAGNVDYASCVVVVPHDKRKK